MDQRAEQLLVDRITTARPDDGFLGEEGAARAGTSGVTWVVDPIDGTVNYLYELPSYAVSVAARVGDEVVAGAVVNPVSGEVWTALRGEGAWLDGRPPRAGRAAGAGDGAGRDRLRLRPAPPGRAGRGAAGGAAAGPRRPPGRGRVAGPLRASPPAGWTATTSRGSSRGTWRPAGWSPARPARWSPGCTAGRRARRWWWRPGQPLVGALVAVLEGLDADADPLA